MNRFVTRLLSVVCTVVGILALSHPAAAAALRPHVSGGTAQFVSPTDFVGTGNATHLGRYTEVGHVAFSPTADPAVLHIDATNTYTAANGDQLRGVVTGSLNGVTGVITATITYVGGTGRFANAGGSAALTGQLLPGGAISVSVSGTIDY